MPRWWRRWRPTSTPPSARPSTCRPTTPTKTSRACTCRPGSRAEGPGHLPAQQRAGLGAQRHAHAQQPPRRCRIDDANRRLALERLPAPVLASPALARPARAARRQPGLDLHGAAPVRRLRAVRGRAVRPRGWPPQPFEVWVNGAEQPRGLGALAKTLSMDLRANDAAWLQLKLDALATVAEERPLRCPSRPWREAPVPGRGGGHRRGDPLALRAAGARPLPAAAKADAGDRRHVQPRRAAHRPVGTLAWAVDVDNPATGEPSR
jgi:ribonucleoside-diphosphate reductase alpha chain